MMMMTTAQLQSTPFFYQAAARAHRLLTQHASFIIIATLRHICLPSVRPSVSVCLCICVSVCARHKSLLSCCFCLLVCRSAAFKLDYITGPCPTDTTAIAGSSFVTSSRPMLLLLQAVCTRTTLAPLLSEHITPRLRQTADNLIFDVSGAGGCFNYVARTHSVSPPVVMGRGIPNSGSDIFMATS